MAVEWSGLAPELLVRLDRSRRGELGAQLQEELREAVRSGRLAPGERLPSTRALAARAGRLARPRRRTATSSSSPRATSSRGPGRRPASPRPGASRPLPAAPRRPPPAASVDFRTASPTSTVPDARLDVGARRGRAHARRSRRPATATRRGGRSCARSLAAYLRRVRGASVEPDSWWSARGFRRACTSSCSARARRASPSVGVEDPGRPRLGGDRRARRARAVPVRSTTTGRRRRGAVRAAAGPPCSRPAHQCPTGVVLTPERRQALVDVGDRARRRPRRGRLRRGVPLRPPARRVAAGARAGPRRRRSARSASRSRPRCGSAGSSARRTSPRRSRTRRTSPTAARPALDQLALARLIESGRYDRHLRRMRALYARSARRSSAALAAHAPEARADRPRRRASTRWSGSPPAPTRTRWRAAAPRAASRVYPLSGYRFGAADHHRPARARVRQPVGGGDRARRRRDRRPALGRRTPRVDIT